MKTYCTIVLVWLVPLFGQDFTTVAKKAIPAVVSVKVEMNSGRESDPFGDDLWNRFFNFPRREQQESPSIGQGSGFLVSPDGYVLTNNHIVEQATKITVLLQNGKEYKAEVVGKDTSTDVAVLKIEGKDFPHLAFGNSGKLEVGQWVVAIGNPLGLNATLTVGVVSAVDRSNLGLTPIENFIQTDAAINRGNSGGPLLNMEGEVIGINTAIASSNGGYMGIGFAIPSNLAALIMEQLIHTGSFKRGYLGVILQQIDPDLAEAFNLDGLQGALVAEVAKDSPAENAGLKRGDIILKFNDHEVENISSLRNAIALMKPEESVTFLLQREGKSLPIPVKVGTFPGADAVPLKIGIQVTPLTPEIAQNYGYGEEQGVAVSQVAPGSLAALAGIKKGSLILSVNQKEVKTPEEFYSAVRETAEGKPTLLLVKQGKLTHYVSLRG